MSGHRCQPSGIAAGSPAYASITPASNPMLAMSSPEIVEPHLR